jgi:tetratricopeptide (TPR) repeat protein
MKVVFMLCVAALLIGCSSNMISRGATVETQNALNKGNYTEALENADIAESFGDLSAANTAKLYYLRGQSLEGLGRLPEAVHRYQYVVKQHGNSAFSEPSRERLKALSGCCQANLDGEW